MSDRILTDVQDTVTVSGRIQRRLSLGVAWHQYDPRALADIEDVVEDVIVDLATGWIEVAYVSDLDLIDLPTLRAWVDWGKALAGWRYASACLQLAESLATFHALDLPQGVIHPGRIARRRGRLVLLPTLMGPLPPISRLPSNEVSGWLDCVAPEVLRSRAESDASLFMADVYSLGRVFAHLLPEPMSRSTGESRVIAARVVEGGSISLPPMPVGLEALGPLLQAMVARRPDSRPDVEHVRDALGELARSRDPERQVRRLLEAGEQPEALAMLDAVGNDLPSITVVALLDQARRIGPESVEIFARLARAYGRHTSHPQQYLLAAEALAVVAESEGWRGPVMDEWLGILARVRNAEGLLLLTDQVPWPARTARLVELRVRSLLAAKSPERAWIEGVRRAPKEVLSEVARALPATWLVQWLYHQQENIEPLIGAIIWSGPEMSNVRHSA